MINFEKLRWKNFLSTGNSFTEVDLNKSSTSLILGKNGSGKSTILDALTFVLFGKPYRKINKPQLINSINNGDTVVEIDFSINKVNYKIRRGLKPNLFEIYSNGKLVDQNAKAKDYQEHLEKFILKLNFKSFTQVVILGSATFVPFMQLSAADRRTIIEEILDIQIFSSMNNIVKDKLSSIKENQKDVDYNIKLTNEKIEIQKNNIEENKRNFNLEIEKKKEEILNNEKLQENKNAQLDQVIEEFKYLSDKVKDKNSVSSKNTKLLTIKSKFEDNIQKLNKEILFYETNDTCPTCSQEITEEAKNKGVQERKNKIEQIKGAEVKLKDEIEKVLNRIEEIEKVQDDMVKNNNEIVKLRTEITGIEKLNKKITKEVNELIERMKGTDASDDKLKLLSEELKEYEIKSEKFSTDKQYYEFAASLLKDTGIKTKIIKQYLPIMNKLINKYLSSMDFFVNFNLNENFEETIKSRYRDEFSYASFSEGEKQKIDIALLLTWRQVAKMKNSTNTNLLILDEIFDSSLDTNSVDLLLNILNSVSNDTNIFVISHKGDQLFDKFNNIIRFVKKNNFSQVEK